MGEVPENSRIGPELRRPDAGKTVSDVRAWFIREVLPHEAMLMRFLDQNWRNKNDLEDLRQEIYAKLLEAAYAGRPEHTKAFILTTARNLLINRVRREHVVPIEAVADISELDVEYDAPDPERIVLARDSLRRLHSAIEKLPPRCREAVILRRVEGLSRREIAERMGIGEKTVAEHITNGMYALADFLFDNSTRRGA